MQAITSVHVRARPGAVLLAVAVTLGAWCAMPAGASAAYSAASAKPRPLPKTGWHGRPIQRPAEPVDENQTAAVTLPASWDAGAVGYGTGYHHPGGSRRVREVQRRLTKLGYRTGPIDGLYGPRTRSAVQWFQIKHGLQPTGFVAATTLAALRNPGVFADNSQARAKNNEAPSAQRPAAVRTPTDEHATHDQAPAWLVPVLLALLAVMLLIGAAALFARRFRSRSGLLKLRRSESNGRVIGYVSSTEPQSVERHAAVIEDACASRGWALADIVDDRTDARAPAFARPGLTRALGWLENGAVNRLVVHRLEHLAGSLPELQLVLGWFMRAHVPLTALDASLDTDTPRGQARVRAILAAHERPRPTVDGRKRPGLSAGHGRPVDREELARRIRDMRDGGMTLQAIADRLNEERVPTARGGSEWRRSSVNSLLGYRRPQATAGTEVNGHV